MKRDMLRKSSLFAKFPNNDPVIQGSFFKFRKLYSRACKKNYREFKFSLIAHLDNMYENDPEFYWKLFKKHKKMTLLQMILLSLFQRMVKLNSKSVSN